MKLRRAVVKNFRNLTDIDIPIDDYTVLIGENNSGKTSFLDALSIALLTNPLSRNNPFEEYDYYLCKTTDSPETNSGILIELWFSEDNPNDWPDALIQALHEIIQIDLINDLDQVGLRIQSRFDPELQEFKVEFDFLTLDGKPLGKQQHFRRFQNYIRFFYLSALRDADQYFSSRSQHWGKILRSLEISEKDKRDLLEQLSSINEAILKADPRLEQVQKTIANAYNTLVDDRSKDQG